MNYVYVLLSTKSLSPSTLHVSIVAKADRVKQMVASMLVT